LRKFVR